MPRDEDAWEPRRLPRAAPEALPLWWRLSESPEPPEELWCVGSPPGEELKTVAVVGSRRPSRYGLDACAEIVRGLAGYPIAVVSGLALGVDAAAHKAALEAGVPTIAVPGSGLAESALYPRANLSLARRIFAEGGCLLSELEPEEGAAPWIFPKRNRLIAALADAVVVVEAAERSGTVITACLALDYGREVLAVPGQIFSELSRGSNRLLAAGAAPACSAEDVLLAVGIEPRVAEREPPPDLAPDARELLSALGEPRTPDELAEILRWPYPRVAAAISVLELHGLAVESAGAVRRA